MPAGGVSNSRCTLNSVAMSGHVEYERSRSPGEIEGESASHDYH